MEQGNTTQKFSFPFCKLRYRPFGFNPRNLANIWQIKWSWIKSLPPWQRDVTSSPLHNTLGPVALWEIKRYLVFDGHLSLWTWLVIGWLSLGAVLWLVHCIHSTTILYHKQASLLRRHFKPSSNQLYLYYHLKEDHRILHSAVHIYDFHIFIIILIYIYTIHNTRAVCNAAMNKPDDIKSSTICQL